MRELLAALRARAGRRRVLALRGEAAAEDLDAHLLAAVGIAAVCDAPRDRTARAVRTAGLADQVGVAVELGAAVIRGATLRGAVVGVAAGRDALVADDVTESGAAVLARRRLALLCDAARRGVARPRRAGLDVTAFVDALLEQAMGAPQATALAGRDGRVAVPLDAAVPELGGELRATVGRQPCGETALLQLRGAIRTALLARGRLAVL